MKCDLHKFLKDFIHAVMLTLLHFGDLDMVGVNCNPLGFMNQDLTLWCFVFIVVRRQNFVNLDDEAPLSRVYKCICSYAI